MKTYRGIFEKVPDSEVFWIRYVDAHGRYRREKAGSFAQATKLLVKRQNEKIVGKKLPESLRRAPVSFNAIADAALEYSRVNKRSYSTDKSNMTRLKEWFGNRDAESITTPELESRLNDEAATEKWAPSTFNHYRSLLRMVYREARRADKVKENPARDIRHKKEDNSRVRFLSRADENEVRENGEHARLVKVVSETYPEHLAELTFALSTGVRLGSQYGATYEMISFGRKELNLPTSKTDEALHVPLNADALAALRSLPSWQERKGPIFRNQRHPEKPVLSNDHWFKPALKAAGIVDFKWHDLRHTFASWLIQDGVPLDRVSKLLGHKSLAMTMRYAHLAPNKLHEDVALLAKSNSTTLAPAQKTETAASASFVN